MELWLWWSVALLAVFLIGVTKSGFGSGVGLMIVPMMAIAMGHIPGRGSQAALGLLLPLLVLGDLISVWQYRKTFFTPPGAWQVLSVRQIMRRLLPGTFCGVALGALLLWYFHSQQNRENGQKMVEGLIRTEIGVESVLLVSLHWWNQYRGVQKHLMPEPLRSHAVGAFAGASSTLAHAAGPIIAMYLLPLKLDRQLYVGTSALYFFILNSSKLPVYWQAGQFEHAELGFTLKFLPLVVCGALFGFWVNKRLGDKVFTKVVYLLTFVLGWYILIDGAASLFHAWR